MYSQRTLSQAATVMSPPADPDDVFGHLKGDDTACVVGRCSDRAATILLLHLSGVVRRCSLSAEWKVCSRLWHVTTLQQNVRTQV